MNEVEKLLSELVSISRLAFMSSHPAITETDGDIIYKGFSSPGTPISAPRWCIQRQRELSGCIVAEWAVIDGASDAHSFNKSWDKRLEYDYL